MNEDRLFSKFIYSLIIFNVVCLILESFRFLRENYGVFFSLVELVSVIIFTIEYLVRILISISAIKGKFRYVLSWHGIIDVVAILPFYLPLIFPFDLRVLRILRLLRIIRVFKLSRYSNSFKTINEILKESRPELLVTVFIAFILLTLSSTLIFYAENAAQPYKFSSILDAFWWSLGTLTTVGYEEAYPITPLGRFFSALIAVIGIGFVALPTGIISSSLIEKVRRDKSNCLNEKCPNCGFKA